MRFNRWTVILVTIAFAMACAPRERSEGSAVRLNPSPWTANPERVGGVSLAPEVLRALSDRDLHTTIQVAEALRLETSFGHELDVVALKVGRSKGLRIVVDGEELESLGAGGERWARLAVPANGLRNRLEVLLEPIAPNASLGELEVWGVGRPAAPRDPSRVVEIENADKYENLWEVPGVPVKATLKPGEAPCASFTFSLPGDPAAVRRAFLVYEGRGLKRSIVLRRSVNGYSASGGLWLGPTTSSRKVLDELHPVQLEDLTQVSLCLPEEATAEVEVETVRLFAELDDGTNLLDRDSQGLLGAAWDLNADTTEAVRQVDVRFARPIELDSASLTTASAIAGEVELYGELDDVLERSESVALEGGRHEIGGPIGGPITRVRIVESRGRLTGMPSAAIGELAFAGSAVGPVVPSLAITYPRDGEHFGSTAYVSGFVDLPPALLSSTQVFVAGERVASAASFGHLVRREEGATGPWSTTVAAVLPDGRRIEKVVTFTHDRSDELTASEDAPGSFGNEDALFGAVDELAARAVGPEGGTVSLGTKVKLVVPDGALATKTTLSIQRRAPTSVPRLDAALINVTAPDGAGYKFRPAGQKFQKPVRVHLPYSSELLPSGMSPEEIKTWYFDESDDRWKPLPRVAVHRGAGTIESETDHFTFMVNAVLVLPDSPGPASFNPNSLKDLKAADPSSGIDLIEPPSANSFGTARVAFPIRLPPARGAFQPSASLSYDSGRGNGWVGMGWDVPVSRIDVETRFGVPRYDGTERYLLDGEQLVPTGAGKCLDGSAAAVFMKRAERDFLRIRRCGTTPSLGGSGTPFSWEVTDKSGVVFVYGAGPGRLVSYQAAAEHIAAWMLERVVDANGNLSEFSYYEDSETAALGCVGGAAACEQFRQLYLSSIRYSGSGAQPLSGGAPGRFTVEFALEKDSSGNLVERPDVTSSARSGFKTVLRHRLDRIRVRFDSTLIREYELQYEQGDFGKSLVKTIIAKDGASNEFFRHELGYTRKAQQTATNAFSAPVTFGAPAVDPDTLTRSTEQSSSSNVGIGVSLPGGVAGVSARYGIEGRQQEVDVTLVDLNGDRLPDRVSFDANGNIRVLYNQATPGASNASFEFAQQAPPGDLVSTQPAPTVLNLSGLGREYGLSYSSSVSGDLKGGVASVGANLGSALSMSWNVASLMDANGDGLVDAVSGQGVAFQRPRSATCGLGQANCRPPELIDFVPSQPISTDSAALAASDPAFIEAQNQLQEDFHPEDAVIQWVAPFAGEVSISSPLQKRGSGGTDGVQVRLFHNGSELAFSIDGGAPAQGFTLAQGDTALHQLSVGSLQLSAADRLYFVVSTKDDFPVDSQLTPVDEVKFDPTIRYTNRDQTLRDATGKVFEYSQSADFRLAGDPIAALPVTQNGELSIETTVARPKIASDDVRVCLQRFGAADVLASRRCGSSSTDVLLHSSAFNSTTTTVTKSTVPVTEGERLIVRHESDTPFDPASATVSVEAEVTQRCDASGCHTNTGTPIRFDVPVFVATHQPARSPLTPFVIPRTGTYELSATFDSTGSSSDLHFTVMRNGARFQKATLKGCAQVPPSCPASGGFGTATFTFNAGEQLLFEAHAEVDASAVSSFTPKLREQVQLADGGTDFIEHAVPVHETYDLTGLEAATSTFFRNGQPLSGGFRGWRHLEWNGRYAFDEAKLTTSVFDAYVGLTDQQISEKLFDAIFDPSSIEYEFLTRFAPMSPAPGGVELRPGTPVWRGRDGFTWVGPGFVHGGRKGGYAFGGGGGAATTLDVGNILRLSLSQNSSAGLNVLVASASASFANTSVRGDVVDINGDGIVDIVSPLGASITTPTFGRGPTIPVPGNTFAWNPADPTSISVGTGLRHSRDLSVSLGAGNSPLSIRINSSGKATQESTGIPGAPVLGGIGVAMSRQALAEDLADVNGDGLPDKVRRTGARFEVLLNLGNGFATVWDEFPVSSWSTSLDGLETFLINTDLTKSIQFVRAPDADREVRRLIAENLIPVVSSANVLGSTTSLTLSGNLGFGISVNGFGAGVTRNLSTSLSQSPVALVDVTGDGLPDYVKKGVFDSDFRVQVNLGHGFGAEQSFEAPEWKTGSGGLGLPCFRLQVTAFENEVLTAGLANVQHTQAKDLVEKVLGNSDPLCKAALPRGLDTLNAYGVHSSKDTPSVGGWLGAPVPVGPVQLNLSSGVEYAARDVGFELGMQDIDGDGFLDHVLKTRDEATVHARVNQLGGGNLLWTVSRPLGGSFELFYARAGNTVELPESRFVLERVVSKDGRSQPGATRGHDLVTTIGYEGGKFDRGEREFFGFSTVRTTGADGTAITQSYRTDAYATRGLLNSEEVVDAKGAVWTRTTTFFEVRPLASAASDCIGALPHPLNLSTEACEAKFAALTKEVTEFFEGQPSPGIATTRRYEYDCVAGGAPGACYGNVTSFTDEGQPGAGDDVIAAMTYSDTVPALAAAHMVSLPLTIQLEDASGKLLRSRTGSYDARGNLEHLASLISAPNLWSESDLEWTPEGNLKAVIGPANAKGQRYRIDYSYDPDVQTHVVKTVDSFGLSSTAAWDVSRGELLSTVDSNGQCTLRTLDGFGRVVAVHGPEESKQVGGACIAHKAPAVKTDYFPHAATPYALTRNALPQVPGATSNAPGTLDTVVFVDGFGRVIQTKKRAEVANGSGSAVGYSVSGHVEFDELGRIERQGQGVFSTASEATYVPPTGGQLKHPTTFTYDVLGRTATTLEPGGRLTTISHSFGTPVGDSLPRFHSEVTDANGKTRAAYRDLQERVVAVEEQLLTPVKKTLTTRYEYGAAGDLERIVDARGNETKLGYDLLGRRLSLLNPDIGLVEFTYDAAGNLVKKVDPNLRAAGQATFYGYDFGRLVKVDHPFSADVNFEYGSPGAPENAAGRIVRVVDEAGEETRGYDALGSATRVTRTVRGLKPGARSTQFTTRFDFDGFGRMLSLTYPDGEVLRYEYDAGGLLASAHGQRGGQKETYVSSIRYDEFGQRVSLVLGNGTTTSYAYEPDTRRLKLTETTLPSGRAIQKLSYTYDAVGNITAIVNALGAATHELPGAVTQTYQYDDLYRLTRATGRAEVAPNTVDSHESVFDYDDIHNLTRKRQDHVIREPSGQEVRHRKTNHDLASLFAGPRPHAATRIGTTDFAYDENGNTLLETTVSGAAPKLRRYEWTEENWLRAVVENGETTSFLYDAAGERVAKRGKYGETTYVGQFYTEREGAQGTKHVFAGGTRIASKLDKPAPQPGGVDGGTQVASADGKLTGIARACVSGKGVKTGLLYRCEEVGTGTSTGGGSGGRQPRTYWIHGDHLGSSNYLTDEKGEVHEHVEYFPYGEVWRQDGPHKPVNEFRFTGKLQDPETELVYFGARYYDGRRARWTAPDPKLGASTDPRAWSPYAYSFGHPVNYTDPNGEFPFLRSLTNQVETESKPAQISMGVVDAYADRMDMFLTATWAPFAAVDAYAGIQHLRENGLPAVNLQRAALYLVPGVGLPLADTLGLVEDVSAAHKENGARGVSRVISGRAMDLAGGTLTATKLPAAKVGGRDLYAEAVAARDALAADLAQARHPPATAVGAYSPSTGKVTAGASRGGGLGCAEGVCFEALGRPPDIQFTPAVRPRTGQPVPVCTNCEATYGRGAFPDPTTRFQSDLGGK